MDAKKVSGSRERLNDLKMLLKDIRLFTEIGAGFKLRSYQIEVAQAIVDSVLKRKGLTIVVMFPRQSGKNEIQAQIEAYLLLLYSGMDAEIVKVSPTWKPQSLNAMRRLQKALSRNYLTQLIWRKEQGYIYKVGSARIYFLSGAPESNIVGATASTLLECDEAQDVTLAKWDKDVAPMAASTNATRIFWGTAWTSQTLLGRELRAARQAEKSDGQKRVFIMTADDVAREVPVYGRHVAEQIAKYGRNHPLVRTQYFSEEIGEQSGLFSPERRALMQGMHQPRLSPEAGKIYALLIDVAGEDEEAEGIGSGSAGLSTGFNNDTARDSTALTVVEVDLTSLQDEIIHAPTYKVINRQAWTGTKHATLYGQIKALAEYWQARYVVIDATGVGAGLASFLRKALGEERVIPFLFSSKTKSELGWDFLSIVETGRFKDYHPQTIETQPAASLQAEFIRQLEHCQSQILDGPGKLMRWGVPDGTRDSRDGELVHDDLVLSAALCAVLDHQKWGTAESAVVKGLDPLVELREAW